MGLDRKITNRLRVGFFLTLASLCFFLVQSRSAFAQVDEGSISGTVTRSI